MKKLLSILAGVLLTALIVSSMVFSSFAEGAWDGKTAATAFASGTGTETDPYIISNAEQLKYFADLVNSGETNATYGAASYKLSADIDLGGNTWTPVGVLASVAFGGIFDGDGHTVKNFYVEAGNAAFFGVVSIATVKNFKIDNANILTNTTNAGGIVCEVPATGILTISNCETGSNVLVTTAAPTSSVRAGGIWGSSTSGGIVNAENCVNRGKIVIKNTGKDDASIGGICGTFRRGYIKNCVNLGKLVIEYTGTKTTHIGGIVGFVNTPEGEGAYIENVISCANISSVTNAGGIIGYIHTSFVDFKIKNAYSLTQNLEANNRGAVIGGSKKTSNTCTVENVTAITIEGVTPVGTGVEIEIATMNPIVSIDELFADLDYSSILAAVGLDSLSLPKPPAEETEPTVPGKPEPEATETTVTDPEVSEPEETKPEETKPEETKPEETKPEDTKPEGTEPTQTPSTDAPGTEKPAEGGCGSVVAGGLAILAVVALAGVALKKRD